MTLNYKFLVFDILFAKLKRSQERAMWRIVPLVPGKRSSGEGGKDTTKND